MTSPEKPAGGPVLDYGHPKPDPSMPPAMRIPVIIFSLGILILFTLGMIIVVVKVINVIRG